MPKLKNKPINSKGIKPTIQLSNTVVDNKIKFVWTYFIFTNIYYKHFTNFFKNENHYITVMSDLYRKIVPWVESKTFSELEKENIHCHSIKAKSKEGVFIQDILKEYIKCYPNLGINYNDEEDDELFYQIASHGGVRLIGKRVGNSFLLYFLDCYHLIYKNDNFNDDFAAFSYTPTPYKENIKLISFESFITESKECLNCEILEKLTT